MVVLGIMDKLIIVLLSSWLFTLPVHSQTMFGEANTRCIDLLEENKQSGKVNSVENWLQGYFSGRIRETQRNLIIVNDLNIPIYDLLIKACQKEPMLDLHNAADVVYFEIP